jgi:hypothetical protein
MAKGSHALLISVFWERAATWWKVAVQSRASHRRSLEFSISSWLLPKQRYLTCYLSASSSRERPLPLFSSSFVPISGRSCAHTLRQISILVLIAHSIAMDKSSVAGLPPELRYIQYEHALEKKYLPAIRALISKDLSEPYSIYVYRYFLYQWGELCFMVCAFNPSSSEL